MTVYVRKPNPRTEYRVRRNERVNGSLTLAEKFPTLKKLTVGLEHFDAAGIVRTGGMNYKLNLAHAKSILCFNCAHAECAGGDFDLTQELGQAISIRQKSVQGEKRCRGIRHNVNRNDLTFCQGILRYKLTLCY
jgi:hypothetical protein